jgi:signal transduction histidine kinase
MQQTACSTYFAAPERAEADDVARINNVLTSDGGLCAIINAMPEFVMIAGPTRQVLLVNRAMEEFAISQGCDNWIGLRPGEILACRHALEAGNGCGTGEACRSCGAVETILSALSGSHASHECRIMRDTPQGFEALDLKVWGTPFQWQGMELAIVVAIDISDEKRRKVLERLFFHDILNTAGAIDGLAQVLLEDLMPIEEAKDTLLMMSQKLVSEIRSQRELLAAENGELTVRPTPVNSHLLLESVKSCYENTVMGRGRNIIINQDSTSTNFYSDEQIMSRVLGNLLQNALEATSEDGTVTLGCITAEKNVIFWCNNHGVLSKESQLQIFNRSFTTKGEGRGIGLYSVKLMTERYLKGKVYFTSEYSSGTTFTVSYPLDIRH